LPLKVDTNMLLFILVLVCGLLYPIL